MRNILASLAVVAVLISAPVAASAQGLDIQGQISMLLEQIKVLQQKIVELSQQASTIDTPVGDTVPASEVAQQRWCSILRSLSIGSRGDDVTNLQGFLREKGYLSEQPTGYFGPLTAGAVAKWQGAEGISAVGAFGPVSRARLIGKWCKNDGGVVGNVRFDANPQWGDAPLTVTFSTWLSAFRMNTVSFTIDYGDGTSERAADCYAPADACQSPGQNTHTYTSNGTYTATLNKIIDPCAGQTACRAAVHSEVVGKLQIFVGTTPSCTKEYRPICGLKQVQCIKAPCYPVQQTYSNECMMKADGATYGYEGVCKDTTSDPSSDPKCKAWYDGCNNCARSTPGGPAMCTLRACLAGDNSSLVQGKAYCTAWFDGTDGNKPPVISSFSGPTTLAVGATGTWSIGASDPENGTLGYSITWGDEAVYAAGLSSSALASDKFVQTTTFTHSYSSAGTYTVGMTVRDSAGASARTSTTVKVGDTPVACTMEYAPVCGIKPWECPPTAVCAAPTQASLMTTYSNKCQLRAAGATFQYEGECKMQPVACTADAKQCPDGSWVGRTGPNCEFACPSTSISCQGYDVVSGYARSFREGEATDCINDPTNAYGKLCIDDAWFVCSSGKWQSAGGLGQIPPFARL